MRRREGAQGIGVGGATLLMIFAVLCLVIFAVLALLHAKSGEELALRASGAVEEYYAADSRAEEVCAELLACLEAGEFPQKIGGTPVAGTAEGEAACFTYRVEVNERQAIEAVLRWDGEELSRLSWKLVPSGPWVPEDTLSVWSGEFE